MNITALAAMTGRSSRCAVCGRSCRGTCLRLPTGGIACPEHPWCEECATAHLALPCREQAQAIRTTGHARDAAAQALAELDSLGIHLPRVPLDLVPSLPPGQLGRCITRYSTTIATATRDAHIQICSGLGPTRFGLVAAHEHTHALIHLHGRAALDRPLEEGLCQMVALVWLTSHPDRATPERLHHLWNQPDPAYGAMTRHVVTIARRAGVGATLTRILTDGRLP